MAAQAALSNLSTMSAPSVAPQRDGDTMASVTVNFSSTVPQCGAPAPRMVVRPIGISKFAEHIDDEVE